MILRRRPPQDLSHIATCFEQLSSPNPTIDRTFQAVFAFPQEQRRTQNTPPKCYRNPVILAQEWQNRLKHEHDAPTELARKLRVSRARVTQVMRLLRLTPAVLQRIAELGDPLPSPIITERMLRPVVALSSDEQKQWIGSILRSKVKNPQVVSKISSK